LRRSIFTSYGEAGSRIVEVVIQVPVFTKLALPTSDAYPLDVRLIFFFGPVCKTQLVD
jgi:hypothetical protein